MKQAYIFPGQGSQYTGMGKNLSSQFPSIKTLFEQANETVGFDITKVMFEGTAEDLKQTKVTQPAIFIYSVAIVEAMGTAFKPDMVAGHSLGEFSALVAAKALSFKDGLTLVTARANAMQKACEAQPSTMAAVLALDNATVEKVCSETTGIVVAANYNCPGQLVISGEIEAVENACDNLKEAGAKRALILPVGGAFHSPLMEPAQQSLQTAIENIEIKKPICPVYQNYSAEAATEPSVIQSNIIKQLTAPVLWMQSIEQMIKDGATTFTEAGPGKVLTGLMRKIDRSVEALKYQPEA